MNLSRAFSAVKNWWWNQLYEGAIKWGDTKRARLPGPYTPRDVRFDVTQLTRSELVRKSRWFEANDGIANCFGDLFEQFTVGAGGLQIDPDSSDEKWNDAAREWWTETSKYLDLNSKLTLSSLQSISARREFFDGEILIVKTYNIDQVGGQKIKRPRIQLIEAHRIVTPPDMAINEGISISDGWELDARRRPIAVWIIDTSDTGETIYRRISSDNVIVVGEPCRPGQLHPLPYLYPVIGDLQDLMEIQRFSKEKAKDLASITRVLETPAGEFKTPAQIRREQVTTNTQTSAGVDTTVERTRWLQNILGPRALAVRVGEKLQEFLNNTPTVADSRLWDVLLNRICIGVGIPRIMVFPDSIQGTVARGEYDRAAMFFRSRSMVHIAAWTEVYLFFMDWAVKNVYELSDPPADWKKVCVAPPRGPNVDVGRNSAALIGELAVAATNYDLIYQPLGLRAKTELRKSAKFAKMIRDLADEFKITPGEITQNALAVVQAMAAVEEKDQQRKAKELETENA